MAKTVPSVADQSPESLANKRYLLALENITEVISSELELDALLALILKHACALIGADDGTIGLYDGARRVVRTAAIYQMPAHELGTEMAVGQGLAGRVLASGRAIMCRYGDLNGINLPQLSENHVIGVPIKWRQVLVGVFGIGRHAPRIFSPQDSALLELLARPAAVAIHNAQRLQDERRRTARFALIAQVAVIIQAGGEILDVLQNTADAMHALLEFESVDIPLIDPQRPDTLVVSARGGAYKLAIRQVDRIPITRGIMGAAARERRSQLVNDVANDPRYVNPPGVTPPRAELAVPILHAQEILGVLNVEGSAAFDSYDRQSLELIADHLGLAITNARLNEQARTVAVLGERNRLAAELHDNVTQLVSSISLLTQTLPQTYKRDPVEGERRAGRIHELAQTAFAELRNLLRELKQGDTSQLTISRTGQSFLGLERLREGGLAAALERLLPSMMPDTLKLQMQFEAYVAQDLMHEEALYRVCQEAVSNVIRHAGAKHLQISGSVNERIVALRIADDGCGIQSRTKRSRGLGLGTMQARMTALGGALRVSAARPHGTQIELALPRRDRTLARSTGPSSTTPRSEA
jgi:two-component system, NarL family, sensor kinase